MKSLFVFLLILISISSCGVFKPKYSKPKGYDVKARAVLIEFYPLLRECYIQELDRTGRSIAGSVTFKINVQKTGRVELVKLIDDTLRNKRVKGCFVKTLHQIKFPPHDDINPKQVNQPFKFNPPRK